VIKQSSVDLSFQTGTFKTKNQFFRFDREGRGTYPGIKGEVT